MKNILTKVGFFLALSFLFIGGVIFVNAQNTVPSQDLTAPEMISDQIFYGTGMMNRFGNQNFQNDNSFPFERDGRYGPMFAGALPGVFMAFAGLGLAFAIVALLLLAFWIWMLVHAVKHDIDYKPVWILVLWFLNIVGAIVYYFAVKRDYAAYEDLEEVCVCENGKCVCGHVNAKDLEEVKENLQN